MERGVRAPFSLVERASRRRALPRAGVRWACHGRYFVTNPARVFRQRGWGRARRELPIPRRGMATGDELGMVSVTSAVTTTETQAGVARHVKAWG